MRERHDHNNEHGISRETYFTVPASVELEMHTGNSSEANENKLATNDGKFVLIYKSQCR